MTEMGVVTRAGPSDVFAEFTVEAWMVPALARAFSEDRLATVARFARENGFDVPTPDEITEFELPENPVGDVGLIGILNRNERAITPDPNYTTPSGGCPPPSAQCSVGCVSVTCTQGCTIGFCVP